MKKKQTRRTSAKKQQFSTAPKRLLQLNFAFSVPTWLTWENVGHIGKNNIAHLVQELREEIPKFNIRIKETNKKLKTLVPHSKASKEAHAIMHAYALFTLHRKEVIAALHKIAKTVDNKPQLPGFGEFEAKAGMVEIDLFNNTWRISPNNNYLDRVCVPLAIVQSIRTCKDRTYLRMWKKIATQFWNKSMVDYCLTAILPSPHEIATKRFTEYSSYSDPSAEMLAYIEQDKALLATQDKN